MNDKFIGQHDYELPIEGEREDTEENGFPIDDGYPGIESGNTSPTTLPTEDERIDSSTSDVNTTWLDSDMEKRSFIFLKNLDELIKKYAISFGEYTLYVDMDGVLVDFDEGFKNFNKIHPKEYTEKNGKDAFWKLMQKNPHFFLNLDWMLDGKELWNYVKKYDPIILTTPAHSMKYCKEDKKKWVRKHLGKDVKVIFSSKKEEYANSTSILIDDRDINIIPWKEIGGIDIQHTSTKNTISKLQELFKKGD